MVECSFKNLVVLVLGPVAGTSAEDFAPGSRKDFFDIQTTIECGFTLKRGRDMTRRYSEMHPRDKYSEYSSIFGQFGQMV